MNNTSDINSASRIVVPPSAAASVELPAGAAIHGISGRLWLTQEGDARDHVVTAGTSFCTDRAGRVVLSAIDAEAVVLVRDTAPHHCVPGTVRIDSMARIVRDAHAAQAEYMAGAFVEAAERMWRFVRGAGRSERSAGEAQGRTPQRFRGFVRSH